MLRTEQRQVLEVTEELEDNNYYWQVLYSAPKHMLLLVRYPGLHGIMALQQTAAVRYRQELQPQVDEGVA